MSELKHTPGPWTIDDCGDELAIVSPCCTFAISSLFSEPMDEETRANAKLIAQSPAMLHDLQQIKGIMEVDGREGCTWGDTEYDSRSVAYGYNLAVAHAKQYLSSIDKATK